jgi:hypothetical protein
VIGLLFLVVWVYYNTTTMSKSIHFFGQSVFGQLISLIDRSEVKEIVKSCGSDRFCKGFYTWDHLVSMLFCTLGNCTSLREVAGACLGLKGKTEHLGLKRLPKRSTLSDANKRRTPKTFELIYNGLLNKYRHSISDSRVRDKFGKQVYIIDSTTIGLFKAILKCVGRKPVSGKEKGGIKVHTLLNSEEQVPQLVWFTDAAANDITFWNKIKFQKDAFYVFDKGYIDYTRYEQLSKDGIHFVTRLKDNAVFEAVTELELADDIDPGVIKDEWIKLSIRKNGLAIRTIDMRRVAYWDDKEKRTIVFLTNQTEIDPGLIAALYKQRWQIETLFKQLKQNFPLKYFLGDNANAVVIQIWCTLIANLLLTVIRERIKRKWSFSNLVSFSRLHLFNHIHLIRFLENPEKDWEKELFTHQLLIFSG